MNAKKLLSLIMAIIIMLGTVSTAGTVTVKANNTVFTDLEGHWAASFIESMYAAGRANDNMQSVSQFNPDSPITRAEAIEIIIKANYPRHILAAALRGAPEESFHDTDLHPLKQYISLSKTLNIVAGYENGTFRPDGFITREELATALVRSQDIFSNTDSVAACFSDVPESRWSYRFIHMAAGSGLVNGYPDGTFMPQRNITRAEAYALMQNYFNASFHDMNGFVGFTLMNDLIAANTPVSLYDLTTGDVLENTLSNQFGQFRLNTPITENMQIVSNHNGFLAISQQMATMPNSAILAAPLALVPAIQLQGKVLAGDSTPIAKGQLLIKAEDVLLTATTDANGGFTLSALPHLTYRFYIMADGEPVFIGEAAAKDQSLSNLKYIFKADSMQEEKAPASPSSKKTSSSAQPPVVKPPVVEPPVVTPDDDPSFFSILNINATPGGNDLAIEVSATEACFLEVQVLSDVTGISTNWTGGSQLSSQRVPINNPVDFEYIPVNISLPDHFVVVAQLVDSSGRELNDRRVFIYYTQAFERYSEQTIHDFESERVINVNPQDGDDTNFVVATDNMLIVNHGENGKNFIDVSRANQHMFVFEQADDAVSSLKQGDRLIAVAGDELHLITVQNITLTENAVTITDLDADIEIGDFFDVIKIDFDKPLDRPIVDMANADPGVTLVNPSARQRAMTEVLDEKVSFDHKGKLGENLETTANMTVSANGKVKLIYDKMLFPDMYELLVDITFTADVKAGIEVESSSFGDVQLDETVTLGEIHFPVGTGVSIFTKVELPYYLKLNGDINAEATLVKRTGFSVTLLNDEKNFQLIEEQGPKPAYDINATAGATFATGVKLSLGVAFAHKVAQASINAELLAETIAEVEAQHSANTNVPSKHLCHICAVVKMDLVGTVGMDIKLAWFSLVGEDGFIDGQLLEKRKSYINGYYWSMWHDDNSIFDLQGVPNNGPGECPNVVYRTFLEARRNSDQEILTLPILVASNHTPPLPIFDGVNANTKYLYPGKYTASASLISWLFSDQPFSVSDSTADQKVVVLGDRNRVLTGYVTDSHATSPLPLSGVQVAVTQNNRPFANTTTDANGEYSVILPAGDYQVTFSRSGFRDYTANAVIATSRDTELNVKLYELDESILGTLTGIVKDSKTNEPIAGAWVRLLTGALSVGSVITGADGRYSIVAEQGDYDLQVMAEGYGDPALIPVSIDTVGGEHVRDVLLSRAEEEEEEEEPITPPSPPTPPTSPTNGIRVAAGIDYTLVVKPDNSLWRIVYRYSYTPDEMIDSLEHVMDDVAYVFAFPEYAFVTKTDGSLWAIGYYGYGNANANQWGNGGQGGDRLDRPMLINGISNVVMMDASRSFTSAVVALTENGEVWVWNSEVLLFLRQNDPIALIPYRIPDLYGVTSITYNARQGQVLALKDDGSVWAFGSGAPYTWNEYGYEFNNRFEFNSDHVEGHHPLVPRRLFTNALAISTTPYQLLVGRADGTWWAWQGGYDFPIQVMEGNYVSFKDSVRSEYSPCIIAMLDSNNSLWVYKGETLYGELDSITSLLNWENLNWIKMLDDVLSYDVGDSHVIAVKQDGTVWEYSLYLVGYQDQVFIQTMDAQGNHLYPVLQEEP